ncbi:hypothetical protein DDB_G0268750 [Dictyostelium discoideum AX4]|uniref:Uncharacterized protein n=1 Tax=Dictyostelium discoideum TaxID=44689 RepID=Q55EU3_DICDI|nr:hypothetical protein DDB_G0268750 [Dictyostelium discoideum AX4]EAL72964.1 hypothetical protein DDB_G0268750 [Dictyostelium discoideum AX4]|eukprot:XP_646927.1 hypothetical protein DDB_G0268750 [Dictyostelium discoideum AX4]
MTISGLLKNLSFKNISNNKILLNNEYISNNSNKYGKQELTERFFGGGGFSYSPKGLTPH